MVRSWSRGATYSTGSKFAPDGDATAGRVLGLTDESR